MRLSTPPRCGRPRSGTRGRRRRRSKRSTSAPPGSSGRWAPSSAAAMPRAGSTSPKPRVASTTSWQAEPAYMQGIELPSPARAALLSGQSGILTVAWQLSPDDEIADTLFERVTENAHNDANEIMWGSPGNDARRRRHARVDGRHALAGGLARERPRADAETRGRRPLDDTASTVAPGAVSDPLTAWSAMSSPCAGGCPRTEKSSWSGNRRPRWPPGPLSRTGSPTGPITRRWVISSGAPEPRHRHLGGRLPRRGTAPGRSGARLACGAARRREGLRHLPRDGRERLRALEDVRAHR